MNIVSTDAGDPRLQRLSGSPSNDDIPDGTLCLLALEGDRVLARCSLSVAEQLVGVEGPSLLIGHYEAKDEEAGVAILRHALEESANSNVRRALGPMNGSTWKRYRLALDDTQPAFLGEPQNPPSYPKHFQAAGFGEAMRYESRIDRVMDTDRERIDQERADLAAKGIMIRPLMLADFENELYTLYELSLASFHRNPYYTPIDRKSFVAMYAPMKALVDPSYVFIANDSEGEIGFVLCYADPLVRRRLIVKSLATLPRARGLGIGRHFMDCARLAAKEGPFDCQIHALMQVQNASKKISHEHHSELFREYVLYEHALS